MRELDVKCPVCQQWCSVNLERGELGEGSQSEGFEVACEKCGCEFSFDVYVDIMNKKVLEQ